MVVWSASAEHRVLNCPGVSTEQIVSATLHRSEIAHGSCREWFDRQLVSPALLTNQLEIKGALLKGVGIL